MTPSLPPPIAITTGDPAGVGPELSLRLLQDERLRSVCLPLLFGDAALLARVASHLGYPLPEATIPLAELPHRIASLSTPAIVHVPGLEAGAVTAGEVNAATGRASFRYVEAAIEAARAGFVCGVATAPIHKQAWQAAGIAYPGHTELFAERAAAERSCMMLTSEAISCSLVTTHIGLADVPHYVTCERIVEVIDLSGEAMQRLHGRAPRLAVCGLNPHSGEGGLFGRQEEERIIVPAIDDARARGWSVRGPLPADTAFVPALRSEIDCYICMYHDQGLIPLKALAFDTAVNVTLGLPIVRTSVDHGTALDLAWQGRASPRSLQEAVRLAVRLATASTP